MKIKGTQCHEIAFSKGQITLLTQLHSGKQNNQTDYHLFSHFN